MSEEAQSKESIWSLVVGGKNKNWLWTLIKFILALGLVMVVVSQTDVGQLVALRERISFGWLGGYFGIFCLLTMVKAYQYWALFGLRVPYRRMLRIVVWQNSLSNLIATGVGIASYLAMLRAEQGIKLRSSGVVFIITKVGEVLFIGVYLALSARLSWSQIESLHVPVYVLLVGISAGVGVFLIAVIWREKFLSLVNGLVIRLRLDRVSLVNKVLDGLRSLATADQASVRNMLGKAFGLSFLYVSITNVLIVASLQMFSIKVGIWPVVFVASFLQLFANVPVQIFGGLGVSEVTSVYVYGLFGIENAEMAAAQLGIRAVFFLSNIGLLLYLPIDSMFPGAKSRTAEE